VEFAFSAIHSCAAQTTPQRPRYESPQLMPMLLGFADSRQMASREPTMEYFVPTEAVRH
jgi:hypothetical protein